MVVQEINAWQRPHAHHLAGHPPRLRLPIDLSPHLFFHPCCTAQFPLYVCSNSCFAFPIEQKPFSPTIFFENSDLSLQFAVMSESSELTPIPLPEPDKAAHLADMASELVELNGVQMSPEMLALMERGLHSVKLPKALRNQKSAESFQDAFELIGGTARLALWADKNPGQFYQIFGKQMAATIAPVLATMPSAKKDESGQWPAWLESRRLEYQERNQVVQDINVKEIGESK